MKAKYLILSFLFLCFSINSAYALDVSLSVTPLYQGETDLDGGGDFNVNRNMFRLGLDQKLTDSLKAGISFSYIRIQYH
ncbi:MAG: hypothetical protein K9L30_08335 [Desulfobacterales bacterium]|nr:hypothetical protein [Desulfobacterales bacterium]